MKRSALHIWTMTLLALLAGNGKEIRRESGDIVVRGIDGANGRYAHVQIQKAGQSSSATIELDNTVTVMDVLFVGPRRIVVHGGSRAEMYVPGDIVTVIDAEQCKVIDSFWGWNVAFSPDLTKAAYQFRVPPSTGQTRLSPAILAYDFRQPPLANRAIKDAPPSERGIVLYPERHRKTQSYWVVLDESEPDHVYVSPVVWSGDSRLIAVIEHEGLTRDVRLVILDVSKGLHQPFITLLPIRHEEFLDPQFWTAVPKEFANAYPSFRDLRFSEDGKRVVATSWRSGPYTESAVTLTIPGYGR